MLDDVVLIKRPELIEPGRKISYARSSFRIDIVEGGVPSGGSDCNLLQAKSLRVWKSCSQAGETIRDRLDQESFPRRVAEQNIAAWIPCDSVISPNFDKKGLRHQFRQLTAVTSESFFSFFPQMRNNGKEKIAKNRR